jgi:chromosome segregation ATPase
LNAEKRATLIQAERDEMAVALEQAERARKQAEYEAADARDQANDLNAQVSSLGGIKRKLEGELQALHVS